MPVRFRLYSSAAPVIARRGVDRYWLRDVTAHAKFVWLILPAIQQTELGPMRESELEAKELALQRLAGRDRSAYLCIYTRCGLARWAKRAPGLTGLYRTVMQQLRAALCCPIGVVAEELHARFFFDAGERPDAIVLDSPIVSRDELLARWFSRLDWPGYVRSSWWRGEDLWRRLRMHFDHDQLITGIPSRSHVGRWRASQLSEPEIRAVRERRPLSESLTGGHHVHAPGQDVQ